MGSIPMWAANFNSMVKLFIFIYRKLKGSYSEYSGGCLRFHFLLKKVFAGEGYYNSNHIITKIGENYYDINGEVKDVKDYLPITYYGVAHIVSSFKDVVPKDEIIKNI